MACIQCCCTLQLLHTVLHTGRADGCGNTCGSNKFNPKCQRFVHSRVYAQKRSSSPVSSLSLSSVLLALNMADVKRPASPGSPTPGTGASSGFAVTRPHGANAVRRRAPAAARPTSSRAAGAGGSSNTMLKLYTDSGEAGLKVDPFVVIVLSLSFIASIFFLHIAAKIVRAFSS